MNKIIIPMAVFFFIMATTAYSQSTMYKKNERGTRKGSGSYHMMMYEQAEEDAQNKYAIITEEPEGEEQPDAGKTAVPDDEKKASPKE